MALTDLTMTMHDSQQTPHGSEPADGTLYSNRQAKLGEAELVRFREMYLADEPTSAICRTLSISQTSVSNYAKRLKLPLRNKRPPLTEAQMARLRELYFAGVVSEKICEELRINYPTLLRYIEKLELPRRKRAGSGQPRHPNGKLSEAEVAAFREMYQTRMPVTEICRRLSISISSAYRYANKLRLRRTHRAPRSQRQRHPGTGG